MFAIQVIVFGDDRRQLLDAKRHSVAVLVAVVARACAVHAVTITVL